MKKTLFVDNPDLEVEAEAYDTWHIEKWRNLSKREHGPVFECGGSKWRVLFFPFGNQVESASFYLEHGFEPEPPPDWYACVQFGLVLWNPRDPSVYESHSANHRFNAKEGDWGFTRFVDLRKAFNQTWKDRGRPLVENDEAMMTAYVRVIKDPTGVLWHNFEGYDSKKETGMVGLKNQGATCYLNSLLQSLYFTDAFRKAVYQIPTENEASKSNSAWTLQRLFYKLQVEKLAVSTSELTASFGWDSRQIFEQQDVQELSRILMERLEERMKGTAAENALPHLFVGKSKTYISCINVDFESSRVEDFWDIQLNVRGNKNLHESFMDYIQVETLEGDNKYDAGEPYKLQDAKKGVIFESFPPVLHLQLKRFEYDVNRDAMMKVNDRHEFPEEIDLAPYLSEEADKSESWLYQLHGVLVHSGDFNAGHYYAFLKPKKDGFFYKFDDDRVTRATMKEVLEENYGGEYTNVANGGLGQRQPYLRGYSTKRSMSAYMLVYIRKSRLDEVLVGVTEKDIPPHIEKKVAEEQAELARRKKEREEAHLYLNLGLITERTFRQHHGFDLTNYDLDINDPAAPQIHRILRKTKIGDFAATVAKQLGVDDDQVRFWVMVGRQNKTNRPDQPIKESHITVEEAWDRYGTKGKQFYLFAETFPRSEDGKVNWPEGSSAPSANSPLLVFLKYFDVKAQTMTGVGHVYVKRHSKVSDIVPQINELMGWDPSTTVSMWEEIKYSMIEPMKTKSTFAQSEIQDGDIVCFQQNLPDFDLSTVTYSNAQQYYDYLLNRIPVTFYAKPPLDTDPFTLNLSKKMTYDQFCSKVGEYLKVDPTHIRFATVHASTGKPKAWVKRALGQTLHQILIANYTSYGYNAHRPDSLFYEVLEISLADFETKRPLKVVWLPDGVVKEDHLEIFVPRAGYVSDAITALASKLKLELDPNQPIRMFSIHGSKIHMELSEDYSLTALSELFSVHAERVPEEEMKMTEDERTIFCYHFDKEPSKAHGIPFKFVVKPGEVFKDTRERLSKRTGLKGKVLQQVKFAVVSGRGMFTKPRYLEDEDVLFDVLVEEGGKGQDQHGWGSTEILLGLDHVNKARLGGLWGRAETMFIK